MWWLVGGICSFIGLNSVSIATLYGGTLSLFTIKQLLMHSFGRFKRIFLRKRFKQSNSILFLPSNYLK